MTVPSKNWTSIADTQVDADSPLDTTLITALRDDLVHLKEWLGANYTAAQNHNHDGVNSAGAVFDASQILDGSVAVAKLKMAQGSFVMDIQGNDRALVPVSRFSHLPVIGNLNNSSVFWYHDSIGTVDPSTGLSGVNTVGSTLRVVCVNTVATPATAHLTWDCHVV
ncbi:hypothetical protein EPN18_09995 [bacterium]|nr:MAG: hypothetical protein EPN18_09995 [bacterium]